MGLKDWGLRRLEVGFVDLSRHCLLTIFAFETIGKYRGVSVYVPVTARTRKLLFRDASAFALGEGIFLEHKRFFLRPRMMRHEYEHVCQLRRWGLLFPVLYALEQIMVGYDSNFFEVEANQAYDDS